MISQKNTTSEVSEKERGCYSNSSLRSRHPSPSGTTTTTRTTKNKFLLLFVVVVLVLDLVLDRLPVPA